MTTPRKIKCLVVGDGGVGKTTLIANYTSLEYPQDIPNIYFEEYCDASRLDGKTFNLLLWDLVSQDDFDGRRHLSYLRSDACLVCFSLTDAKLLESARKKWGPEIRSRCPTLPIILVGNKLDLRDDPNVEPAKKIITHSQVQRKSLPTSY